MLGKLSVLFISLILSNQIALAQWPEEYPAADSPYWWTLTSELTPQELRTLRQDRAAHQRRFMEDRLGRDDDPFLKRNAEELRRAAAEVRVYVNGKMTPELFRLPEVFSVFFLKFEGRFRERNEVDVRDGLADLGLSASAIELIIDVSTKTVIKEEALIAETKDEQAEFAKILEQALLKVGRERYRKMLHDKDLASLADATGWSEFEVRKLNSVWLRDPTEEVSESTLVALKEALSPEDWRRFRSYLFTEIAPDMSKLGLLSDTEG